MKPPASSSPATWSLAGGNPRRTGRFDGVVKPSRKPKRSLRMRAAVAAPVLCDDADRCFVVDLAGTVRAWTIAGRLLWERTLPGGVAAAPAVATSIGRLFVGTLAGSIHALDTRSGALAWEMTLPSATDPRILSDLLVLPNPGLVVASSWGGRFCALTGESGEVRFSWDAGLSPRAAASADADGNVYCLRARRDAGVQLVRVDAAGAESILHQAAAGARGAGRTLVAAAPVIDEAHGRFYAIINGDRSGELCAWSLATRELLWRYAFERAVAATPAVRLDGVVLVADMNGGLHGITPAGARAFHYGTTAEYLLAPPVCDARGRAFVGDPAGALHAVEPDGTGRVLFEAPRSLQVQPSFDGPGRLYVPGADHRVHVFANLADA